MSALHLFLGEEDLLVEERVRALIDRLLPPQDRALNLDVVDAATTPAVEITTRLDTLPFFGAQRVVLIRHLDELPEEDLRILEEYLARGLPPAVAIFTARALDRRGRLFRTFQKQGTIHPCDPLSPRDAPAWVVRAAAALGKRMGPQAAGALVALAGTHLRTLALEVEKLAAYVGERQEITAEDVEAVASRLAETSVFALTDAIGERNPRKALQALEALLQTEHPLSVLALIAGQYRRLARAVAAGARSETELAEAINVHPYAARKLLAAARHYRAEDFAQIFVQLEDADRAIKSTGRPELALEMLVVGLCRAPAHPAGKDTR
ncbi:MAG: DNA polymerase III subunit delta [Armatimonadota bacterium]|nr:DNA polymerase III subunit delta [Armatimonadota bacterium]MDR7426781.1 DNA polymerase III subunit delta [Armatimonadota bacterium]MDR7469871.1 DNA polymerase III subunit delta [Armatimonadota bacterium]MDR7474331.1 DNA polymerase III subunit delta [Armatimonadota bacterium]MDR7539902.1 DNA polymerase III subunit delta [Armatimonadota bacterium]